MKGHLLDQESKILIHPAEENPENFIKYRQEVPYPLNDSSRGKKSIKTFGLDRKELNDKRLEYLNFFEVAYVLSKVNTDIPDIENPFLRNSGISRAEFLQKVNDAKEIVNAAITDEAEFAGMIRSNFPELVTN